MNFSEAQRIGYEGSARRADEVWRPRVQGSIPASLLIGLGIVVVLALTVALLVKLLFTDFSGKGTASASHASDISPGGPLVEVVSVRTTIPAGATLDPAMIEIRRIPRDFLHARTIHGEFLTFLYGQQASRELPVGSPVLWSDLLLATDRSLSEKLPFDMRAVSVQVDQYSGVDGMLIPGDRVDVIATMTLPDASFSDDPEKATRPVSRVLLQNIPVLAIDGVMNPRRIIARIMAQNEVITLTEADRQAREIAAGEQRKEGSGAVAVTLGVNLDEASLLAFADEHGTLRLVLRPRDDVFVSQPHNVTPRSVLDTRPSTAARSQWSREFPIIYEDGARKSDAYLPPGSDPTAIPYEPPPVEGPDPATSLSPELEERMHRLRNIHPPAP